MKEVNASTNLTNKTDDNNLAESAKRKWIIILYFCSIGGIIIGVCGLCLTILDLFEFFEKASYLHKLGNWFIIVAFPLIMFSGHASNEIGKINQDSKY